MGYQPRWYPLVAAARYLGVSPWELERAPIEWIHRAGAAMYAEEHARSVHSKNAK